jgi:hypothetical protein
VITLRELCHMTSDEIELALVESGAFSPEAASFLIRRARPMPGDFAPPVRVPGSRVH